MPAAFRLGWAIMRRLRIFEATLARSEEEFFDIAGVEWPRKERSIETCFDAIRCNMCGELVTANYVRCKKGELLCIPCSGYKER
ncbi:MAG TPA: hypothetical protein ENI32_04650 [Candidatus Syntrophoarchaeum butanivorans]|uniref:DksA C4-type domain-containing protein n=1 Tax=Candidatus Syntropharchaeum butanivorans TaxID=1839936 RepID=A0A1F2P380_9EURY|nr:MAG: hypothetical protein SBU_001418 [Candidatus Syntrophoarchaeum butanivorans]HEC57157.1 hypothetical protein [Candidatus Syntrophoarchaeum butanivorans]